MKKVGQGIVVVVLIWFALNLVTGIFTLCFSKDLYKTTATVTFVGLPEGTVFGNFTDSKGNEYVEKVMFQKAEFSRLGASKINQEKFDRYVGSEITILYDEKNDDVLDYGVLLRRTLIGGIGMIWAGICLFVIHKRTKTLEQEK